MSKYIPTDNKPKGQAKPKLKVKVVMNEKETILNEYDAFQMISELKASDANQNKLLQDLAQAVSGIMDGMKAGAAGVTSSPSPQQSSAPQPGTLKLPKLNKVSKDKLSGGERFYGSDGGVKLES
jgi:hypothetical protein